MSIPLQGPSEDLDYSHNWAADLDDTSPSDTIATSAWTLSGPDDGGSPSPTTHTPTISSTTVTAWVSGLQFGGVYTLQNVMVTAAARTFEHSWVIRCGYK